MSAMRAFPLPAVGFYSLPRAQHLTRHIQPGDRTLFWQLLTTKTLDEIAEALGPGYTRRLVEYRLTRLRRQMFVDPRPGTHAVGRIAMVRIAYGIDPCWCEPDVAYRS